MIKQLFYSSAAAFALVSCATPEKEDLGGGIFDSIDNNIVLQLTGTKKMAFISPYSKTVLKDKSREKKSDEVTKAKIKLSLGQAISAEKILRKYLQKNPADNYAISVLSAALTLSRQYSLAAYYAKYLIKNGAYESQAYNMLGLSLMNQSNTLEGFAEAERAFRASIGKDPKEVAAALNLGYLSLEMGNNKEALKALRQASKRCNKCSQALLGYGVALKRTNDKDLAKKILGEVEQANNLNAASKYHLAHLYYYDFKKKKNARKLLKSIISNKVPGSSEVQSKAVLLLSVIDNKKDKKAAAIQVPSFLSEERTKELLTDYRNK